MGASVEGRCQEANRRSSLEAEDIIKYSHEVVFDFILCSLLPGMKRKARSRLGLVPPSPKHSCRSIVLKSVTL